MAYLNDEKVSFKGTISELLKREGYDREKVVVLLNGNILKRELWDEVYLKEEDYLEVVSFVGGG
ncbi:MAG: sulfur carrier protein ThiS [Caloramator sp.]|nr:sulfur carrier protein ThiS [Caloramator sp.]